MLEKQKIWCDEKIEKGKEFVNNNKVYVGFMIGCSACCITSILIDRVFLTSKDVFVNFGFIEHNDGTYDNRFFVETYGVNRFGKNLPGYKVAFGQENADWFGKAAHHVCDIINEHNKTMS